MRKKLFFLFFICIVCALIYIFAFLPQNPEYALNSRTQKLFTIILVGVCTAVSTLIFQSISNNKILTPSIIGFDSLYVMIQVMLVFFLSSANQSVYKENINFGISLLCMMVFTLVFYKLLFKEGRNIYLILLLGLVFGTFFSSLSSFFEVLIDPDEFLVVQGRMFASFNNIQGEVLSIAFVVLLCAFALFYPYFKFLDTLSLGRDLAINLGLDYQSLIKRLMIFIAILVSISTALVGPITFLGLLVANITYELFKTHKHSILLLASCLISVIALLVGDFLVSKIFEFNTTISVVINFIGGFYFIYLVLKGNKL